MTNEPLTIGFPYAADRFGGSNVSSFVLARALKEMGHRVFVIAHGKGRVIEEANGFGLPVERLPPLSPIPGYARPDRFRLEHLFAFRAARGAIERLNLNLVHTNDLGMLRTWAGPARSAGVRFIAHWRSNYSKSWSVDTGLLLAQSVISVSRYSRAQLPGWAQAKTVVEYNPFEIRFEPDVRERARNEIRARLGLPRNAAIAGAFGNHIVRKRTHVLADILNAIPATEDGRPVFGLACGGKAEPYDVLLDEKIVQYGLGNRLLRPGFVRPVESWMSACDVIIAPATQEPLARSVLEAQGLGIPVVVSTDGGLGELIDESSGILCDPHNLPAWILAVRRVLDDRLYAASLSKGGRDLVAALTPHRHAERILDIYRTAGLAPRRRAI